MCDHNVVRLQVPAGIINVGLVSMCFLVLSAISPPIVLAIMMKGEGKGKGKEKLIIATQ